MTRKTKTLIDEARKSRDTRKTKARYMTTTRQEIELNNRESVAQLHVQTQGLRQTSHLYAYGGMTHGIALDELFGRKTTATKRETQAPRDSEATADAQVPNNVEGTRATNGR